MTDLLRIVGAPGSPYSRKLRAVLRYRRIPHAWVTTGAPESAALPTPRVGLLPQLIVAGDDGVAQSGFARLGRAAFFFLGQVGGSFFGKLGNLLLQRGSFGREVFDIGLAFFG